MLKLKSNIPIAVIISSVIFFSCNQSTSNTADVKTDSSTAIATTDSSAEPVYNPSLDPAIVGASFTKKLADSLGITILEATMRPGDSFPMHSHPDHAFYLMDTSTALLWVPGTEKPYTLKDGVPDTGWVMGPFNDAGKNIGKSVTRWVEIDIHRPRGIELPGLPAYDSSIDAFTHPDKSVRKIADSLGIKLFIVTMKPGDSAKLHSHPDHAIYVLEGGKLAVSFQNGPRQIMELKKGMGIIGGPFGDAAKNIGKSTVKLLITHIYRPRNK
jgi:quercetin dioxygenase-like cupin family protein